eukprot:gene12029-15131_t
MQKRDVAIVLLSCVAMLVSLQNEGTFSFRKAWYHAPETEEANIVSEHHQLPPPVVADLNGDGHLEIVAMTTDLRIQKHIAILAGRRPVAMHVGYIDPLPKERVRPPRKQVVVVLTASWQVLCFDHNLNLLWERDVRMNFPHHAHIKEVRAGDRGLIVVGASVERGDILSGEGLESASTKTTDLGMAFGDDDILKEQLRTDSRHFSYFAAEAESGDQRWHHTSTDFHKDLEEEARELIPQHDFRLDAEKLEGRHFGESSCRDYRNSLLHILPHSWDRPSDTRLEGEA